MGALIPGIILVCLYMLYILIKAILKPGTAPTVAYEGEYDRKFFTGIGIALVPPLALIFAVLGSIISGIATVNQAGAIGAVGAIVMGGYRLVDDSKSRYWPVIITVICTVIILILLQFFDLNIKNITNRRDQIGVILAMITVVFFLGGIIWSAWRTYKIDNTLVSVMVDTAKTTSMVFIILIGAAMLTAAFRAFGGEHLVREFLTSLPGGFWTQFLVVMLVIFLLGFFLDFIEIAVVVVPIVAPILLADPSANITAVWLGVMIGLNIQTSFLTPPFGFALFYLRGVAPPEVKTTHIYKGVVAFIVLQLVGLAIAGYFPSLVNYMPNRTYLTSDTAPPPVNPKLQLCIEEQVFNEYDLGKDKIINSVNAMRSMDLSILPEEHRDSLTNSFDLVGGTFGLVDQVRESKAQLDDFSLTYRPIHVTTRQIKNQEKSINRQLKKLHDNHKRLSRNTDTDPEITQSLEEKIENLEFELKALDTQLPENWESERKKYLKLASAEKTARLKYRRNVDESYAPLQQLMSTLDQTNTLTDAKPIIKS